MREELDRQRRGGAFSQFFNRPKILASLFLLVVGLIVWFFWPHTPGDPQALFTSGQNLMQSDDPEKWEEGWNDYLAPLVRDFPHHPLSAEAENLHHQVEDRHTLQRALGRKKKDPASEAQRFYLQGLRQVEAGDLDGAKATWQNLTQAFAQTPADNTWCLAREGAST